MEKVDGRDSAGQALPQAPSRPVSAPTDFDLARGRKAEILLRMIVDSVHSHMDGRDLLAEIHPRRTLDIKRRVDGQETWHEGDWLSDLSDRIDRAKAFLFSANKADNQAKLNALATEARRAETENTGSIHEGAVPEGETP